MITGGRIDPHDPQRTEVALTLTTVTKRVLPGLDDGLFGNLEGTRPVAVVALSRVENFLVLAVRRDATFNACHD